MQGSLKVVLSFFNKIGLAYSLKVTDTLSFLPGVEIDNGHLVIDIKKLLYPGDILHEAGHLACMPK